MPSAVLSQVFRLFTVRPMQSGGGGTGPVMERVIEVRGRGPGASADAFVRAAGDLGLTVVATGPNRFRLARTYRPGWAVALAVVTSLCVGLGLLFLLVKRTESADAVIVEDRMGVHIRIVGSLNPAILDRLESSVTSVADPRPSGQVSAAAPHRDVPPTMPAGQPASTPASFGAAATPSFNPPTTPVVPAVSRPAARVVFALSDGRRVTIANGGVVGRNPRPDLAAPGASLVPVDDPSLSKSHLTFGPSDGGVWVVDLHSTNGTSIEVGNVITRCEPGHRVSAPLGAVVIAGDVRLPVVAE